MLNTAVFERLDVKDGRITHQEYRPPFDDIFEITRFESETRVEVMGLCSNPSWLADLGKCGMTAGERGPTLGGKAAVTTLWVSTMGSRSPRRPLRNDLDFRIAGTAWPYRERRGREVEGGYEKVVQARGS